MSSMRIGSRTEGAPPPLPRICFRCWMCRTWIIFHNISAKKLIIRGVYDTIAPVPRPHSPPRGQPSPLTSSGIKQMLTVRLELRSRAHHTELRWRDRRRDGAGGGGGDAGPPCPQLSEPANDSSQGGCCKRAGKLKQTLWLGAATLADMCRHSEHRRA